MTTNGLWTRDYKKDYPDNRYSLLIKGNVVLLKWADIEPSPGAFDEDVLEQVLIAAEHGATGLRILGGASAPEWLNEQIRYFTYVEGVSKGKYPMPVWWDDKYLHRWEYMQYVVHSYVGNVVDVVYQTGGATVYGEPMIRSPWDNQDTYNELGFNKGIDSEVLTQFYNIAKKVWTGSTVAVSVFPYQGMVNGKPNTSLNDTKDMVQEWQPNLAGFNDLREDPGAYRLNSWNWLFNTGIPMFFQTANPTEIGDWRVALDYAVEYGAEYVELNRNYNLYDYKTLGDYAHKIS